MTFSHQGTTFPISLTKDSEGKFVLPHRTFFLNPVLIVLSMSPNHMLSVREIYESVARGFGLDPNSDYEFDKELNYLTGLKAFYRSMSYIWKNKGHSSAKGMFELPKRKMVKLSEKGLLASQNIQPCIEIEEPIVEEPLVVVEVEEIENVEAELEIEEGDFPSPLLEIEDPSDFDPTQGLKSELTQDTLQLCDENARMDDITRIQKVLEILFSRENLRKILNQDVPQDAFIRVAAYIAQTGLFPNPTAQWVMKNPEIFTKVRDRILAKASLRQKMQHSIQLGLLEDHIQAWFTTAIANDSLGKVIRQGKPVRDYNIANFIAKRAISYRRDMAQDPSCRAIRGVTRKADREEKAESNPTVFTRMVNNDPRVWSEDNGNVFLADFKDAKAATEIEAHLIQEDVNDVILRTLLRKSPRTGNRLYGIFIKKSQGYTDREIATEEGISINKVRSLWAQVREHLQESQGVIQPLLDLN